MAPFGVTLLVRCGQHGKLSSMVLCLSSCADGAGDSEIPAVVARRGHFGTRDGSRALSVHVDDYEKREQMRAQRQQGMAQQHAGVLSVKKESHIPPMVT
jgi:hypothetical protein